MIVRVPQIKLERPDDVVTSGLANWGWYGVNGVGKSTLAATIPETVGKVWVVSTGVESLEPYRGLPHYTVSKIKSWDQLTEILGMFRQRLCDRQGVALPLEVRQPFFSAVVFDTWTGIQRLAKDKIKGNTQETDEEFARWLAMPPTTLEGWKEWQKVGEMSTTAMGYFQQLPIHKVFLFQEQVREAKVPGEGHLTGPALTPVAAAGVREQLWLLGRMFVTLDGEEKDLLSDLKDGPQNRKINPTAQEQRWMLVGQHPAYATKGDSRRLGYCIADPTWEVLSKSLQ